MKSSSQGTDGSPAPGGPETVEVLVRDRGQRTTGSRGTIELEDLSHVVTRLATTTGPNGPNGPVTQYILAEGARHLSERLVADLGADFEGNSAPRILSALIGHEPFVETGLNLSNHHMRRRWPMAADWYADLISYILRPQRYTRNEQNAMGSMAEWMALPFGALVEQFAAHQVRATQDPQLFRLADILYAIWPDYAPIQHAYARHRRTVEETWTPLYHQLLGHYRLRLRDGIRVGDMCWLIDTVVNRSGHDLSLSYGVGDAAGSAGRTVLVYVAGCVTADDGTLLTLEELAGRPPGG
ncbi:hypothetical protein [Ornithinimicrobium cavernae]|uniref:hypothetical protein n=1 Tax=Ornithinimicrobium cavernae TaxID=2666047 RepID=UPI000D69BE41|nr:hypothetical protein [Ornithinimicrobium cavernae]